MTQYRIEAFNDVHGRWLPITGANGGICLPAKGSDSMAEYHEACDQFAVGGRPRAITQSETLAADNSMPVIKVLVGDEFTGTPLFTMERPGHAQQYGYAADVIKEWGETTDAVATVMVPGNHEFDLGIGQYVEYMKELDTLDVTGGVTVTCANCDFSDPTCEGAHNHIPAYKDIVVDTKTVRVIGITTPELHILTSLQDECLVYDCDSDVVIDTLRDAQDDLAVDDVIILSHMGEDFDRDCIPKWTEAGVTSKIRAVLGSHTHTTPCQGTAIDEFCDTDNNVFHIDSSIDITSSCYQAGDICNNGVLIQDDLQCNDSEGTILFEMGNDQIGNRMPMVVTGVNLFHSGMHGWNHFSTVVNDDGSLSDTKLTPLDSTINGDYSSYEDAILSLLSKNIEVIGYIENEGGFLKESCKGPNLEVECSAGQLYAWAALYYGVNYMTEQFDFEVQAHEPILSIINGGSVRADIPEGEISWVDINNTFPFLNYTYMVKIRGDTIKENIMYGLYEHGGLQMAGARIVTPEGFDLSSLRLEVGETCNECRSRGRRFTERRNATDAELENHLQYYRETLNNSRAYNTWEPSDDFKLGYCQLPEEYLNTFENPWDNVRFQVSSSMTSLMLDAKNGGYDVHGNQFVEDCNYWVEIENDKYYWVVTTDFVYNGGDNYCLQKGADVSTLMQQVDFGDAEPGMTGVVNLYLAEADKSITGSEPSWVAASLPVALQTPSGDAKFVGATLLVMAMLLI